MNITEIVDLALKLGPAIGTLIAFIVGYDRLGRRVTAVEAVSRRNSADIDGIGTRVGRLFSWRKVAHSKIGDLGIASAVNATAIRAIEVGLPDKLAQSRHDVLNQMNPVVLRLDEKIEAVDRRAADANAAVRERIAPLVGKRTVDHEV